MAGGKCDRDDVDSDGGDVFVCELNACEGMGICGLTHTSIAHQHHFVAGAFHPQCALLGLIWDVFDFEKVTVFVRSVEEEDMKCTR